MTPMFLRDALVSELKELFKGYELINSKDNSVDINVYPQRLPIRRKENDKVPFPYILVCMEEGEIKNIDDHNIKIYLIIGIQDSNENGQGDSDVINIITKLYQHLFHKRVINDTYEITYPFNWALQDEDTYPKYIGGAETNWTIKVIPQKEDEYI